MVYEHFSHCPSITLHLCKMTAAHCHHKTHRIYSTMHLYFHLLRGKMNWNGCLSRINSLLASMFRSPHSWHAARCSHSRKNGVAGTSERGANVARRLGFEHILHCHLWFLLHCWRRNYYVIDFAWSASIIIYFGPFRTLHRHVAAHRHRQWQQKPARTCIVCNENAIFLQPSQRLWCAICVTFVRGPLLNQMMTTTTMANMTTKRKTMLAQAFLRQIMNIRYMDAIWFNRHNKQAFAKKKPTKMHGA